MSKPPSWSMIADSIAITLDREDQVVFVSEKKKALNDAAATANLVQEELRQLRQDDLRKRTALSILECARSKTRRSWDHWRCVIFFERQRQHECATTQLQQLQEQNTMLSSELIGLTRQHLLLNEKLTTLNTTVVTLEVQSASVLKEYQELQCSHKELEKQYESLCDKKRCGLVEKSCISHPRSSLRETLSNLVQLSTDEDTSMSPVTMYLEKKSLTASGVSLVPNYGEDSVVVHVNEICSEHFEQNQVCSAIKCLPVIYYTFVSLQEPQASMVNLGEESKPRRGSVAEIAAAFESRAKAAAVASFSSAGTRGQADNTQWRKRGDVRTNAPPSKGLDEVWCVWCGVTVPRGSIYACLVCSYCVLCAVCCVRSCRPVAHFCCKPRLLCSTPQRSSRSRGGR